jgi:hypothetical protein
LKRERWGSPLVQEKYQEEKTCDKRHPYRIIIMIMIKIIKLLALVEVKRDNGKVQNVKRTRLLQNIIKRRKKI